VAKFARGTETVVDEVAVTTSSDGVVVVTDVRLATTHHVDVGQSIDPGDATLLASVWSDHPPFEYCATSVDSAPVARPTATHCVSLAQLTLSSTPIGAPVCNEGSEAAPSVRVHVSAPVTEPVSHRPTIVHVLTPVHDRSFVHSERNGSLPTGNAVDEAVVPSKLNTYGNDSLLATPSQLVGPAQDTASMSFTSDGSSGATSVSVLPAIRSKSPDPGKPLLPPAAQQSPGAQQLIAVSGPVVSELAIADHTPPTLA